MDITSYLDLTELQISEFLSGKNDMQLEKIVFYAFGKLPPVEPLDPQNNGPFERVFSEAIKAARKIRTGNVSDNPSPLEYSSLDDTKFPAICWVQKSEYMPWVNKHYPQEAEKIYDAWVQYQIGKGPSSLLKPKELFLAYVYKIYESYKRQDKRITKDELTVLALQKSSLAGGNIRTYGGYYEMKEVKLKIARKLSA